MKKKKLRHFLFGFLFGMVSTYWYSVYSEQTITFVLDWMQQEADRYQAENPIPKVDSGWRSENRGHR